MNHRAKTAVCKDVVRELRSYGVPADRIIPLMDQTSAVLRMGSGLVWSEIAAIIGDVYAKEEAET